MSWLSVERYRFGPCKPLIPQSWLRQPGPEVYLHAGIVCREHGFTVLQNQKVVSRNQNLVLNWSTQNRVQD